MKLCKNRLNACDALDSINHLLTDNRSVIATQIARGHANGCASDAVLRTAHDDAHDAVADALSKYWAVFAERHTLHEEWTARKKLYLARVFAAIAARETCAAVAKHAEIEVSQAVSSAMEELK